MRFARYDVVIIVDKCRNELENGLLLAGEEWFLEHRQCEVFVVHASFIIIASILP